MSDDDEGQEQEQTEGGGDDRLGALEDKVDKLADAVAAVLGRAHGAAERHEASKLDRPTRAVDQADDARAQMLAALDDHERQKAHDSRFANLESAVAAVTKVVEKAPREFRPVEYAMGWVRKDD